jgi:hypothetical protein
MNITAEEKLMYDVMKSIYDDSLFLKREITPFSVIYI